MTFLFYLKMLKVVMSLIKLIFTREFPANNAGLLFSLLVLPLLWGFPTVTSALESDKNQPVNIESSMAEADYKKGTTTYTGNVLLTQGSLKIEADQLIIHRGKRGIKAIVSKGLPARFQQQPFPDKPPVFANALTITYELEDEVLVLEGDVFIELDGSTHQGSRYEYNLQNQMLNATGDGDSRVTVTFDPMVANPLSGTSNGTNDKHQENLISTEKNHKPNQPESTINNPEPELISQ